MIQQESPIIPATPSATAPPPPSAGPSLFKLAEAALALAVSSRELLHQGRMSLLRDTWRPRGSKRNSASCRCEMSNCCERWPRSVSLQGSSCFCLPLPALGIQHSSCWTSACSRRAAWSLTGTVAFTSNQPGPSPRADMPPLSGVSPGKACQGAKPMRTGDASRCRSLAPLYSVLP